MGLTTGSWFSEDDSPLENLSKPDPIKFAKKCSKVAEGIYVSSLRGRRNNLIPNYYIALEIDDEELEWITPGQAGKMIKTLQTHIDRIEDSKKKVKYQNKEAKRKKRKR